MLFRSDGYVKFCGEPRELFMTRGFAVANLKMGTVGVTVEIMDRDAKLPADVIVKTRAEVAEIYPELLIKDEGPVVIKERAEEPEEEAVAEEAAVEETVAEESVVEEPAAEEAKVEEPAETVETEEAS